MKRAAIKQMPEYFGRYVNLPDDVTVKQALQQYGGEYLNGERSNLLALGDKVYAPGKWTAKDILQHIIDAERVFAYRALRIGRADKTPLPGFDENDYAVHTTAANRTVEDLLEEYAVVRNSTIQLFTSFTEGMLLEEGISSGKPISVLALGFIIAGHPIHHINVLRERYYPLLK